MRSSLVYKYCCSHCESVYVGSTPRTLRTAESGNMLVGLLVLVLCHGYPPHFELLAMHFHVILVCRKNIFQLHEELQM